MKIVKSSGEVEDFSSKKIYSSIRDAGGSKKLSREAVNCIRNSFRDGVTTQQVLEFLIDFLRKEPGVSERYDLKRAVMSLGPSGFPFETFFGRILEEYGYDASVNNNLKGKKIIHEVDIIAKKKKKWMIECKYHNHSGTLTRLHPAMYTYARFLDLKKYDFDNPWLVTNTKCSVDARRYASGVGLKITSWKNPRGEGLQDLIEKKKLYPITILKLVSEDVKHRLYEMKILVAKDLLNFSVDDLVEKLQISRKDVLRILEEINEII
jgi:hypothetical protein